MAVPHIDPWIGLVHNALDDAPSIFGNDVELRRHYSEDLRTGSMKRRWYLTIVVTSLFGMSSCSSQQALTQYFCPGLGPSRPQVLYPIPYTSGVPTAAANFIFVDEPTGTISLVALPTPGAPASNATPLTIGSRMTPPSPLPSPIARPYNANAKLVAISYPQLASQTTYALRFNAFQSSGGSQPCAGQFIGYTTFTTR